MTEDEKLLRKAEEALAEIDREQGLGDRHADVLAALRIRIFGAPKKTLDEALEAAGKMRGRLSLENVPEPKKKGSLENLQEPKKKGSLDDVLKEPPKKKGSLDDLID